MPDALLIELDTLVAGARAARLAALSCALVDAGHGVGVDVRSLDDTARDLLALRAARHYTAWLSQGVTLVDGAARAVADAAAQLPVAVVSRGTRDDVAHVLAFAGLESAVRFVVAAEDVCDGKPEPEGYELALGRLSRLRPLAAGRVLAIENAPDGIAAARRAGVRVVAVGDLAAHEAAEADAFVPTLEGHDLRSLASLAVPGLTPVRGQR